MLSEPQGLVQPEGLGKLEKKKKISSVVEPVTFRLVAQCLNHYGTVCPVYKTTLRYNPKDEEQDIVRAKFM
jgi:hypothetical protein